MQYFISKNHHPQNDNNLETTISFIFNKCCLQNVKHALNFIFAITV